MRKIVGLIALALSVVSYSAIDALSHHSRANCAGFNESVTWWLGHPIIFRVVSDHYPECLLGKDRNKHIVEMPKSNGYRHAAYHATESYNGTYCVVGDHLPC